jgi:catecholate siderophore receptor
MRLGRKKENASVTRIKIRPKKSRKQTGPKYWMAVGTLAAYASFGTSAIAQNYPQDPQTRASNTSPSQTQGLPVRRFDIPPGPLDAVLATYQNVANIKVVIPRDSMRTVGSQGVAGLYTPEKALERILLGTGITYKFTDPGTATLSLEGLSTTVEVTASAMPDTLAKYSEPLVDTPQSISVVPQQVLQSQGVNTLRDALRNVPGISLAAGEGGAQGDNLTIRGFSARNDLFIDGMRDFGSYYRDPFNYQEVEVLEGPSSVTFGRGSTGGVVNQATKLPQRDRLFGGGLEFGTDATRRLTADFDQPLGDAAAFRVNVMGHEGGVAGRDVAENRRYGIAPSLAFGIGKPTRLTMSYLHEQANDTPDYGIPWLFDHPAPVSHENYYGFEHGNFLKTDVDMGTVKFEHDFNPHITMRNQTRYANYARDARITEAKITTDVLPSTPLEDIQVTRNQIAVNSGETFFENQTDVIFTFRTGSIRHKLIGGVEAGRETSDPIRYLFTGVPNTSLLDPNTDDSFAGAQQSLRTRVNADTVSVGSYALDTLRVGQRWEFTGGVRVDRFSANYDQTFPTPELNFDRVDVMTSWRGAVVFKPASNGSIYFDVGNSFNPSAESLSLSAANVDTPPEENKTYEIGTKWDLYSGKLSLRAAGFRTDKTNAREPSADDPTLNVLSGSQRVNGAQIELNGRITSRWQIFSGYAYLDSKVVNSIAFPLAIGAQLANVPRNGFNLWSSYQLPHKLEVGGGGQFVDSRVASSTVPTDPLTGLIKQVPGYWVFNAMASYPITEHISFQANVYNLANKYFYDELHPGHIVLGPGRSALLGLNFKF